MLIGDSITHFWGGDPKAAQANGPASWQATFGPYRTLNLGFGCDRIQNVFWRLDHGELDGLHLRVIVLHIGTNNTSNTEHARKNPPAGIAEGVRAIFRRLHAKTPEGRIILMAVFQRERMPDHPRRELWVAKTPSGNNSLNSWTFREGASSDIPYPVDKTRSRAPRSDAKIRWRTDVRVGLLASGLAPNPSTRYPGYPTKRVGFRLDPCSTQVTSGDFIVPYRKPVPGSPAVRIRKSAADHGSHPPPNTWSQAPETMRARRRTPRTSTD